MKDVLSVEALEQAVDSAMRGTQGEAIAQMRDRAREYRDSNTAVAALQRLLSLPPRE